MNKGRSHGLPIDSLGNAAGSSNWQEFVDDYYNTFHDYDHANRHIGLPAIGSNPSGDKNSKFATRVDGSSSRLWGELLALMEAPSAAFGNSMANCSNGAKNNHIQEMKTQYAVQQRGTMDNTYVADSRGCSSRRTMMEAPPVGIEEKSSGVNGYTTPDLYSKQISHQMQPNVTTSVPLNQSYYIASDHRQKNISMSHTTQHRIPVHYKPHDNLNCTDAKAASGIRNTSQLALLTPQSTKRSHQHSAAMDTALDQNLNHNKVSKDDLAASSIAYPSQLAPVTPQLSKEVNNHQWQAKQRDQIRSQETVQKEFVGGYTGDEFVTQGSQEIIDLDPSPVAHSTSPKERLDNEETHDIDLNKTLPKKAPRRKRHRPRVIVENKCPRKRRPAKAKLGPDGLPMPKRKYVRKSKCDAEKSLQTDARETKKECTPRPASKPCRRSLDLELWDDIMGTTKLVERQEIRNQSHSLMKGNQTEKPYMDTNNEAKRATELCKTTANGYYIPAYQPLDAGKRQPCFQETLKSR